jgi:hypothetical protein
MARTRINPRLAKLHLCYSVEEMARLFKAHPNTVRQWLKKGLQPIDRRKPLLVQGRTLRAFLEARRAAAKTPCPPGTLYCLRCREPRRPAMGMADFITREHGPGNLRALCESCGTAMHRRARRDAVTALLPGIEVRTMRAAPHIEERPTPRPRCA